MFENPGGKQEIYDKSSENSRSQIVLRTDIFRKLTLAAPGDIRFSEYFKQFLELDAGAPNGSVPQNICSSGTFLLAGRCGRNNSPWKESVAGKKIIQGVRGDLKSRIAATGYLYGLLTTQDLNCVL